MKKIMEAMFSSYLNEQFTEIMPKFKETEAEKEFDSLWNIINSKLSHEERCKNDQLKIDSDYEVGKREFLNAFRLGFILCAEVFLSE